MKGLEALKHLYTRAPDTTNAICVMDYEIIQKELKALEIIIKKDVEIKYVKMSVDAEKRENNVELFPAVGFYNNGQFDEEKCLTNDEFEIIREVLL